MHCWRRAAKAAWKPPRPEVARLRMRQAAAVGLSYRQHEAILLQVGRSPRAVFFDLGGTLVRRDAEEIWIDDAGRVQLLPGVAAKLAAMTVHAVFVVSDLVGVAEGHLSAAQAHGLVWQVDGEAGDRIDDYALCLEPGSSSSAGERPKRGMVFNLLHRHGLTAAAAIMVGSTRKNAVCAGDAGLADFIWSENYF